MGLLAKFQILKSIVEVMRTWTTCWRCEIIWFNMFISLTYMDHALSAQVIGIRRTIWNDTAVTMPLCSMTGFCHWVMRRFYWWCWSIILPSGCGRLRWKRLKYVLFHSHMCNNFVFWTHQLCYLQIQANLTGTLVVADTNKTRVVRSHQPCASRFLAPVYSHIGSFI